MMDRALQDALKIHCFGCGELNPNGRKIKSYLKPVAIDG